MNFDRFKSNATLLKKEKKKQQLLQEAISLEQARRETLKLKEKLDALRQGDVRDTAKERPIPKAGRRTGNAQRSSDKDKDGTGAAARRKRT